MYSEEARTAAIAARHNIVLIRQWGAGLDYQAFVAEPMRAYAVQYAFILIQEAVDDIPVTLLEKHAPASVWRSLKGFRNYLAHTYDQVADRRIIDTIQKNLPELLDIFSRILDDIETVNP